MSKEKTDKKPEKTKGVCLHDGGRNADDTWGGCLLDVLLAGSKCSPDKCPDYRPSGA